jgi:hypothetical protein
MSATVVSAFNTHFKEFVEAIQHVFPDDVEIEAAKNALERLRKANPSMIVKGFKTYVTNPYGAQIESGDINFFINKDYGKDVPSSVILEKINSLRVPISQMEPNELENVAKYLKQLKTICDLYV